MHNAEEVFSRIDKLMKKTGRQQKEMDAYLGLAKGAYSHWVQKKSSSYMFHLDEISQFLGVSPNYLILGTEDVSFGQGKRALSTEDMEFLDELQKTKAEDRPLIMDILHAFVTKAYN